MPPAPAEKPEPDEPLPPPVEAANPPWVHCTMACVDAVGRAARLGAQNIGLGDGKVIAEVGEIEIILDGHCDGVVQRNIDFAIADEAFEARRVDEVERRRIAGCIRGQRVMRVRQGHMKGAAGQRPAVASAATPARAWGRASPLGWPRLGLAAQAQGSLPANRLAHLLTPRLLCPRPPVPARQRAQGSPAKAELPRGTAFDLARFLLG